MLRIRRTPERDWAGFEAFEDRLIYQTREWMSFLEATQGGEPVWAEVLDGQQQVGLFSGMKVRKMGVPVLGSPFPGWTTMYMGFNLAPGASRMEALEALGRFAFSDLGCLHYEIADRGIDTAEASAAGYEWHSVPTFVTDLRRSEDELFRGMKDACRRCVRQAEKRGVLIEEVDDPAGFAEEYYDQLTDVFAKQGLLPTYGIERVERLIGALEGTGRLLLLRARDPEGRCIGTGIYPGMHGLAQFWGNASYRKSQRLRPNEALHWHAMRYWKSAGASIFDWGGGGQYKVKYGCTPVEIPWISNSRFRAVGALRNGAERMHAGIRRLKGRLHGLRR